MGECVLSVIYEQDRQFMREAIEQALVAEQEGNVPVGAVIVKDGVVISSGHNIKTNDPTEHAEIIAIRKACLKIGHWNLKGCTLYVTLEPCSMCAGAIVQARISQLVYGADDPKAGACGTLYNIVSDLRLNHRSRIRKGVMAEECALLLQEFFIRRRLNMTWRDGRVVEGGRLEID